MAQIDPAARFRTAFHGFVGKFASDRRTIGLTVPTPHMLVDARDQSVGQALG
jgi:hypothetical protein